MPSETEVAWSAGLFEGEGSIGTNSKVPARDSPRLQIPITDLDVLRKFHAIWGGTIRGPYTNGHGFKIYWRWDTNSWDEYVRIGGALRPYFGERRGARYDDLLSRIPAHFRKPVAFRPCEYAPVPSVSGYLKHRRRGERACAVCLESSRLYYAIYLPKCRAARAQREADS